MELLNADNGMSPAWSPDGRRFAFLSNRLEGWDLYSMALDGSDVIQLSRGRSPERPSWAPDAASVVFERDRAIDSVPATGGDPTTLLADAGWGSAPSWSPQGDRLAFVHDAGLHLLTPDGSAAPRVTPLTSGGADATPAWSPDGARIVFSRSGALWIVELDGGAETRLTEGSEDGEPAWSPDGERVVFVRAAEIWSVEIESRRPGPLAGLPRPVGSPDWSPDGRRLVFHAHVAGNWEIFTAAADGSDLIQVTKATWISGKVD